MSVTTQKGQEQHANSQDAKQKGTNLLKYYHNKLAPMSLAEQKFRVTALLPKQGKKIPLNGYMTELTWTDAASQAWLQGSITLQGVEGDRTYMQLGHGDVIRNEVFWGGQWIKLWDMRIWDPDRSLAVASNQIVAPIYDDLHLLSLSEDDFHYTAKKGGRHAHGWRCDQILADICHKYKIPVGKIAMGTYLFRNFSEMGVSPIDAIIRAYQTERNHSGRRFVLRWNNGKLEVTPLRRNPIMYVMQRQLVDATLHHTTPENFATVLVGRGSVSHDSGSKDNNNHQKQHSGKEHFIAQQNVRTYGYIHKQEEFQSVHSHADLVNKTKRSLAKRQKIAKSIDFSHEGIAMLKKGDACQVLIPAEGYSGTHSIVWVSEITHTLAAGSYVMTPTVTVDDPMTNPHVASESKSQHKRASSRSSRESKSKPTGPRGTTDPNKALKEMLRK